LTLLVPQPEVGYHTGGGTRPPTPGSLGLHMMPRTDGIALGGTSQRDVWTMEPDEDERKRVVDGHIELFNAMKGPARWASHNGSDPSSCWRRSRPQAARARRARRQSRSRGPPPIRIAPAAAGRRRRAAATCHRRAI